MSFRIRSNRSAGHGETNYLASVSDLMAALLLIFIILVAVAVLQARVAGEDALNRAEQLAKLEKEVEARSDQLQQVRQRLTTVEDRLAGNARARQGMLDAIQSRLGKEAGLSVSIDPTRGVLRIPEEVVTFETGSAELDKKNTENLHLIGRILFEQISCFEDKTFKRMSGLCRKVNPNGNVLDAVFIEGHTDNQAFLGDTTDARNRTLSTARSNAVYDILILKNIQLSQLTNPQGESLFSLSGYGSARPVPGHNHPKPTNDSANRRIELRFIFSEPHLSQEEKALIVNGHQE